MQVLVTHPLEGARRTFTTLRGFKNVSRTLRTLLLAATATLTSEVVEASEFLTLEQALSRARTTSPQLAAAREAIAVARGEERQSGAYPNPVFGYQREQTFRSGETFEENVAVIQQAVEIGGQRGLRQELAQRRRISSEAALRVEEIDLDFEVTRAFARALATDERVRQARRAAEAFSTARETSRQRLRAGDISGYEDRRLALETARYQSLRAHARLEQRAARFTLAERVEAPETMHRVLELQLQTPPEPQAPGASIYELREIALRSHPRLRVAEAELAAADSAARLAARSWIPTPVISGGYKREQEAGTRSFQGYVAALSLPLPLWNRQQGTRQAAEARARRAQAHLHGLRKHLLEEFGIAWSAYQTALESLSVLRPHLGDEAAAAVEAAQASYLEGEIRLIEWLDAVRAYQEAATAYADVRADIWVQHAALQRAVGTPLE